MVGKKDKRSNWKITPRYKPDLIGSGHVFVHFSTSFKCVVFDRQQKKLEKKEQCHRLKSRQKVNSIWFFGRVSRVDFQILGIRRLDYYLQKQLLKSLLYLHVTVTIRFVDRFKKKIKFIRLGLRQKFQLMSSWILHWCECQYSDIFFLKSLTTA